MLNLKSILISPASWFNILSWSNGEVKSSKTINYRTLLPEKGGIFCTTIFGTLKNYTCDCGYYNFNNKKLLCIKCNVIFENSFCRRRKMSHLTLNYPVSYI